MECIGCGSAVVAVQRHDRPEWLIRISGMRTLCPVAPQAIIVDAAVEPAALPVPPAPGPPPSSALPTAQRAVVPVASAPGQVQACWDGALVVHLARYERCHLSPSDP